MPIFPVSYGRGEDRKDGESRIANRCALGPQGLSIPVLLLANGLLYWPIALQVLQELPTPKPSPPPNNSKNTKWLNGQFQVSPEVT